MRLEDLDYELPPELIAQHPAARREDARLLIVDRTAGSLTDGRFTDLARRLRAGDMLVVNETRVRPARLVVRRPTGGAVELLVVRPEPAPGSGASSRWRVLAKPAKRAGPGTRLALEGGDLELEVVGAGGEGERTVAVVRGDLEEALRARGEIPLPPYIHRAPEAADRDRYQTVYARAEGAVAAPTAGLHFTEPILADLAGRGITRASVLLHVGPGTFRPVTAGDPARHVMDEEWFEVSGEAAVALRAARAGGGRIVAVGTTTVRALEAACDANAGGIGAARGWTRKYILTPYRFQAVDAMLTNFHLPRTTLLLLVAAFAGEDLVRRAYAHAVAERYRFYSYGDAMLLV
ncbi:MAG TPA: tRNA preQ1(34) S-adenosylmethionine ribosyltransferase-isomerase QueA [Candidatus Eisenbacteria bacterium]